MEAIEHNRAYDGRHGQYQHHDERTTHLVARPALLEASQFSWY